MLKLSRRKFLASTAAGAVSTGVGPWTGSATATATSLRSANEQPVIGYIGCGIRFHSALAWHGTEHGICAAVCDVDLIQAGRALKTVQERHREMKKPLLIDVHEDYRHILDNKDVDAVMIATPDHWHTKPLIEAMKAGKDVYCEKPLTLTIGEGQQIEQVMQETGRIVQVGTQQRTSYDQRFSKAAAIARDGRVGKINRVTVCIDGARTCDPLPIAEPPRQLDWERWQGQCALVDYRAEKEVRDLEGWGAGHPFSRTHRYYRWFYEYSGGKLTDWGAHHVDIAMLGIDKMSEDIGNITIDPLEVSHPVQFDDRGMPLADDRFNTATRFKVLCTFADGQELMVRDNAREDLGFGNGIMFHGDQGRFLVNRGKLVGKAVDELKTKPLPEGWFENLFGQKQPETHMSNFFEAMSTRKQPVSDVRSHNLMLNICHAINIAMRLNRKLEYDPKTRRFVGDEVANSHITRKQRKGYEITV